MDGWSTTCFRRTARFDRSSILTPIPRNSVRLWDMRQGIGGLVGSPERRSAHRLQTPFLAPRTHSKGRSACSRSLTTSGPVVALAGSWRIVCRNETLLVYISLPYLYIPQTPSMLFQGRECHQERTCHRNRTLVNLLTPDRNFEHPWP